MKPPVPRSLTEVVRGSIVAKPEIACCKQTYVFRCDFLGAQSLCKEKGVVVKGVVEMVIDGLS